MRLNQFKKMTLIFFCLMLVGCSTKNISQVPSTDIKKINSAVTVNILGENINPTVIEMLRRELKGQLIIAGFELIDTTCDNNINLNVNINEFYPGSAALRIAVGFGAGRGSLVYTAEYTDPRGEILAKMEGQERFTGLEVGFNHKYGSMATLGGEETATKVLVKEAAMHIVELSRGKKL